MKIQTIEVIKEYIHMAFATSRDFVATHGGHVYHWIRMNPQGTTIFVVGNVLMISLASYLRSLVTQEPRHETQDTNSEHFVKARVIEVLSGGIILGGNIALNSLLAPQNQLALSSYIVITIISLATSILLSNTRFFTPKVKSETHDETKIVHINPRDIPKPQQTKEATKEQRRIEDEERIRQENIQHDKFRNLLIKLGELPSPQ